MVARIGAFPHPATVASPRWLKARAEMQLLPDAGKQRCVPPWAVRVRLHSPPLPPGKGFIEHGLTSSRGNRHPWILRRPILPSFIRDNFCVCDPLLLIFSHRQFLLRASRPCAVSSRQTANHPTVVRVVRHIYIYIYIYILWPGMVWFRWFRRSCSHREALKGLVSLVPSVLLARDGSQMSGFVGSVGPARTRWPCMVWFRWFRRSCSHRNASCKLSVLCIIN